MLKKSAGYIAGSVAKSMAWLSTTRTNYWAEYGLDMSLAVALVYVGWRHNSGGIGMLVLAAALGFLGFSFTEYCFHRWIFHTRIPLFADGHHKHHEDPLGYDALPFFLPALLSLGLTGLFSLVLPESFACFMMAATTFGYVVYGLSHFIIHHVRFRNRMLMRWAAVHHIHHHHADRNYGVTTPLWDYILNTRYKRQPR